MTVPTSALLRQRTGLVDSIGNFGSFPPTEAYRDSRLKGQAILLRIGDPAIAQAGNAAVQIAGIRSHGVGAGLWHPVPPSNDDGALRAQTIHDYITKIDSILTSGRQPQPKIDRVGLNLEGYTIVEIMAFLFGDVVNGTPRKGWRGSGGQDNGQGYRPGMASWWIDEPFKDGSVKPMTPLKNARMMLAVEEFAGAGFAGDMTPIDGQRAIIDRIEGRRSDGDVYPPDAWPAAQVCGCYDAARGVEIRWGLHFTLERARQHGII